MYKSCRILLLVIFLMLFSATGQSKNLKVVFLNPGFLEQNTTGSFWANVSLFMQAAADDLTIDLISVYGERNHVVTKSLAGKVASHSPDYVILVNEKGTGIHLVKELAKFNFPIFMLLNGFSNIELMQLTPKERSLIIGSVIPNNFTVGKRLASDLFQLYKSAMPNSEGESLSHLLALQGDHTTPASLQRSAGLKQFLSKNQKVIAIDSIVAHWSKQQAYQKVQGLLRRKRIDLIWAANDAMAHGAKQAVDEANLDYKVLIGGINWDIDEPKHTIDISYGGHVTLGAYALVMLRDIDEGLLTNEQRHQLLDIFQSSQQDYYLAFKQLLMLNKLSQYNFAMFSQRQNSSSAFSVENLIKTIK